MSQAPRLWELARQGLCSVERGYDLLAPKFDATPFRTPDPVCRGLAEFLPHNGPLLDLGCGTGAMLPFLRDAGSEVWGLDVSQGMLARARQACPEARLLHGDFLHTWWEERFCGITCAGAMGHVPPAELPHFFERVAAALRPGGCFLTTVSDQAPLVLWLFDAAMRVRNWLWRPHFVMYYLAFRLPGALELVSQAGLEPTLHSGVFSGPYAPLRVLQARKPDRLRPSPGLRSSP